MKQKFVEEVSQEELYGSRNPLVRFAHLKRLENIIKMLGNTEGMAVLDIGCGEGFMLERLKGKTIGLDYSMEKLKRAKERVQGALLVRGDATMLPFRENCFDAFIASEVLEHIPNLEGVASEVRRTARKKAVAVVSAPNEKNWRIARLFLLRFPIKLEGHVNSLTPKKLEGLFGKKVLLRENIPNLPFFLCLTQMAKYRVK